MRRVQDDAKKHDVDVESLQAMREEAIRAAPQEGSSLLKLARCVAAEMVGKHRQAFPGAPPWRPCVGLWWQRRRFGQGQRVVLREGRARGGRGLDAWSWALVLSTTACDVLLACVQVRTAD